MDEGRITELWNKAVSEIGDATYPKIITRFAEFVATDEREACAKVCERIGDDPSVSNEFVKGCEDSANAIRKRSNLEFRGATPIGGASPATKS